MIVVEICGGLGNQLFQYALARKLKEIGKEVYLDLSWFDKFDEREFLLDHYSISVERVNNCLRVWWNIWSHLPFWRKRHIVLEKKQDLNFDIFTSDSIVVKGYWQSEQYFRDIRKQLLDELTLDYIQVSEACKCLQFELCQCCSIAVHIRRGDYLKEQNRKSRGGICTKRYYNTAMEMMRNMCKDDDISFYFFSDDIEWVKQNFKGENINYVDIGSSPYEDIWLMSQCKHNIIANSSFSWWGAWLNRNEKQLVIAPSIWKNGELIENIYCEGWIKVQG